jgi:hypothetical protein
VRFVESGKEQIDGTITDYDHLCLRKYTDEAFAMTRRIPLVAEHRWYGLFMLGLALLTASLTNGILAATIPPSIQGLRILLIVAACLLPGILGLLITHIFTVIASCRSWVRGWTLLLFNDRSSRRRTHGRRLDCNDLRHD